MNEFGPACLQRASTVSPEASQKHKPFHSLKEFIILLVYPLFVTDGNFVLSPYGISPQGDRQPTGMRTGILCFRISSILSDTSFSEAGELSRVMQLFTIPLN